MIISRTIEVLSSSKEAYYKWLAKLTWTKRTMLSFIFAGVTGISAQIRIPLPWTPVPITGQVLIVLLSGLLLGKFYAGLSMFFYLALGMCGVPWFAGAKAGLPIGPTTGYIIGFIPAALFTGWTFNKNRSFVVQIGLMIIAIFIIYFFGALHFAFFMKTGPKETLAMAVLPFILVDIVKAVIAAVIARAILQ